jgi:uncharacterized protein YceK
MGSFRQGVLAAVLVLPGAGCSTVATLAGASDPERYECSDDRFVPRMYSGVFNDVAILRSDAIDKGIVVLDLPFSLVADTLVLPYTIYGQIRYGNLCPREVAERPR